MHSKRQSQAEVPDSNMRSIMSTRKLWASVFRLLPMRVSRSSGPCPPPPLIRVPPMARWQARPSSALTFHLRLKCWY